MDRRHQKGGPRGEDLENRGESVQGNVSLGRECLAAAQKQHRNRLCKKYRRRKKQTNIEDGTERFGTGVLTCDKSSNKRYKISRQGGVLQQRGERTRDFVRKRERVTKKNGDNRHFHREFQTGGVG